MNEDLKIMYDLTRRTREVLLEFTESLPNEIYVLERPDFAYGSIRNIHAHVAVAPDHPRVSPQRATAGTGTHSRVSIAWEYRYGFGAAVRVNCLPKSARLPTWKC